MLLPPATAGFQGRLQQNVEVKRGDKTFECLAVVEVSKTEVTMVGMSPLGQRLLRLHWDGKNLESEVDPSLPKELPVVGMLRDLMVAYWPLAAVQAGLKGWAVEETGMARRLSAPHQPRLEVIYANGPGWGSSLTLYHHDPVYEVKVTTLEIETE